MKQKRFLLLFIVIFLIISLFAVQTSLAKYRKSVNQNLSISLAKWDIKLNNESIVGKDYLEGDITPIFEKSEFAMEDVLAPGITGYFDILIDATNVDVSFSYNLTVNVNESELYPDIVAYAYSINPSETEEKTDYVDNITGTIQYHEPLTTIRVYIQWDDSEENTMDNLQDTALAISNSDISMNATIVFTQINQ